eukprot:UN1695
MADGDCVVFTIHFWHPAFQHKNDPDWKMKGSQDISSSGAPAESAGLFSPMGSSGIDSPASPGDDLPPID